MRGMLCAALPLVTFGWGAATMAAEHQASNAVELARVCAQLKPGDTVILRNGAWNSQELIFRGEGTELKPIVFRAETAGKVRITGQSSVEIDGAHLVVSGIWIDQGSSAKEGIVMRGRHCRLTESGVSDSDYKFYLRIFGAEHSVDRCFFGGKKTESPTVQVEVGAEANRHRIEKNHFGPRPALGRNGGETIRIGYSHQSMNQSLTVVESNLFERCDGELEVISNKSCGNIYRANTFLECAGMLTLRHGNRCVVEGNFFLGNGKKGAGGVRVIGEDHVIVNNYVEKVPNGAFWITAGIPDSPLIGYFQARNCLIAFNTVVESSGPCIETAAGLGSSGRTLPPDGITVANNLFVPGRAGVLLKGEPRSGYRCIGNVVVGTVPEGLSGFRTVVADLETDGGIARVAASSQLPPAEGEFPAVTVDIDGQLRAAPFEPGCDQRSDSPVLRRPLSASDVGPVWRGSLSPPAAVN